MNTCKEDTMQHHKAWGAYLQHTAGEVEAAITADLWTKLVCQGSLPHSSPAVPLVGEVPRLPEVEPRAPAYGYQTSFVQLKSISKQLAIGSREASY